VGPPLHRQICHARQLATASLQCPLARLKRRSNGLPPSSRPPLDFGKCNPPWSLLPDLVQKLRQSYAEATIIPPYWPAQQWYEQLSELSHEEIRYPPSQEIFFPGKRGAYEGVGQPGWSVTAFHVPHRPSSTDHAELSTQPRTHTRPRPYPDTSGHPRTTTTPPHV
jgi:hypothetical protein